MCSSISLIKDAGPVAKYCITGTQVSFSSLLDKFVFLYPLRMYGNSSLLSSPSGLPAPASSASARLRFEVAPIFSALELGVLVLSVVFWSYPLFSIAHNKSRLSPIKRVNAKS
jgi:hypothetical protein